MAGVLCSPAAASVEARRRDEGVYSMYAAAGNIEFEIATARV
jgi:hypothetical protein